MAKKKKQVKPVKGCPCARTCCSKSAPVAFDHLAHQRGEFHMDSYDGESQWWCECYSCGAVCSCQV